MPRQARLDAPGTLHHVMIRGIEGKSIFRDNRDRRKFVTCLGNLTKKAGTCVLTWSLLRNHVQRKVQEGGGRGRIGKAGGRRGGFREYGSRLPGD